MSDLQDNMLAQYVVHKHQNTRCSEKMCFSSLRPDPISMQVSKTIALQEEIDKLESRLEEASADVKSKDEQIDCLRLQLEDSSSPKLK